MKMMLRFISSMLLIATLFQNGCNAAEPQYEILFRSFAYPQYRKLPKLRVVRSIKPRFESSAESQSNYGDNQFAVEAGPHGESNAAEPRYETVFRSSSPAYPQFAMLPKLRIVRTIKPRFESSAETQLNYGDTQFGVEAGPQIYIAPDPQKVKKPSHPGIQDYFGSNQIVTIDGSGNNAVQLVSNKKGNVYASSSNDDSDVVYINNNNATLRVTSSNGVVKISTGDDGKKKNTLIYVNGVQIPT